MAIPTIWPITYSCGHIENRDLSDKPAGKRAGTAKWFAAKFTCSRCFKNSNSSSESDADRVARYAKEADERRAEAERDGLPVDLVGSDKQVDWALRVRQQLLHGAYEALVEQGDLDDAAYEATVLEPARPIDRARWWIDNRDHSPADLPELLADPGTLEDGATTENVD